MIPSKGHFSNLKPSPWTRQLGDYHVNMYRKPNIPPRLMVPADINNRMGIVVSKPNGISLQSDRKKQENHSSVNHTHFSSSASRGATTTTQPPMVWFPGSSDCNSQESDGIYFLFYLQCKVLILK